jgi:hypothetical protein
MAKTRINCPNCRQPAIADIDQLIDVGADPTIKQRFLAGAVNVVACQNCGYQGMVATPLVYHDPSKELLLTFFPSELGLPVNEQERIIGPLITKVTNSLPLEKRKAYLLRPQTVLTMQGMIERILEADGITKEMIQAQQLKLNILQRMLAGSPETVAEIARENDALLDREFFSLLSRLIETALVNGDQNSARKLSELQNSLLPITTFGREVQAQSKEVESALQLLQSLGKDVTRDKLLEVLLQASNDTQLSVMVSMVRPGLDYGFFQLLSEKIDVTDGTQKSNLVALRSKLLELTRAIDQQVESNLQRARTLLNTILQSANTKEATLQNLQAIDDYFIQVFNEARDLARKNADIEKISRLNQIEEVLQKVSAPPPELALVEALLDASEESEMKKLIEAHKSEITPQFMELLTSLVARTEGSDDEELKNRMQMLYSLSLEVSMKANL